MNRTPETWDHLLGLLGEMRLAFHEFMVLLRDEKRILPGMDRKTIADVTEKKEQALDVMCRYQQQVVAVLHQLAGSEHQGRFGGWLQKSQQPQASSAQTILQEIGVLTRLIQAQGKKNEARIRRTQHVVQEAIHLIYTGLGTGPVYQGSGTLQYASVPGSVHLCG